MAFVLDASVALPWCFQDEATPETDRLLTSAIAGVQIYVPAHWPAEILNGLTRAARRGRLDHPTVDRFLYLLPQFRISVDSRPLPEQWGEALLLIRLHRLSAYDASYLALAKHHQVPLATFDSQLRDAAMAEGVALEI